jgi:hypothetical protein
MQRPERPQEERGVILNPVSGSSVLTFQFSGCKWKLESREWKLEAGNWKLGRGFGDCCAEWTDRPRFWKRFVKSGHLTWVPLVSGEWGVGQWSSAAVVSKIARVKVLHGL